jgi:hypothetical protein
VFFSHAGDVTCAPSAEVKVVGLMCMLSTPNLISGFKFKLQSLAPSRALSDILLSFVKTHAP